MTKGTVTVRLLLCVVLAVGAFTACGKYGPPQRVRRTPQPVAPAPAVAPTPAPTPSPAPATTPPPSGTPLSPGTAVPSNEPPPPIPDPAGPAPSGGTTGAEPDDDPDTSADPQW